MHKKQKAVLALSMQGRSPSYALAPAPLFASANIYVGLLLYNLTYRIFKIDFVSGLTFA